LGRPKMTWKFMAKNEWMQLAQRLTQRGSYLHNTSYKIYDVDIYENLYGLTNFYNKTKYRISLKFFSHTDTISAILSSCTSFK
jgi:hypothetical protein